MLTTKSSSQNDIVNNIKQNFAIGTVAKDLGLNLTKQGNDLVGNCPTGHHSDSQTCFHVNTKNNLCHCFSCKEGGSVIDLVMMANTFSFSESLNWFNEKYNLGFKINGSAPLTDEELKEQSKLKTKALLYEAVFFEGQRLLFEYEGKDALDYLVYKRNYPLEKVKEMEVIYFPISTILKKNLTDLYPELTEQINELKLNGHFGDNFRLAFPYRDMNGHITGFVKRSINPVGESITTYDGKYHENVRFDSTLGLKKDDLFGLHRIKGIDTILIVEGYMDAMYLHTLGQQNIVAVGAGLLSEKNLNGLTSKRIKNVVISFDNDSVGSKNTQSAVELLLKNSNINTFVIDPSKYGNSKDPDEFVKHNGFDAFQSIYKSAVNGIDWLISRQLEGEEKPSEIAKTEILNKWKSLIINVYSRETRNKIIDSLAIKLQIKESVVKKSLGDLRNPKEFWYFTDKGFDISHTDYLDFIKDLGFYKYYKGKEFEFIKIENNIVNENSSSQIKDEILSHAEVIDRNNQNKDQLKENLVRGHFKFLNDKLFECLYSTEVDFKGDGQDSAFLYFQNCIVKVSKEGKPETFDYKTLEKPIWASNINERTFTLLPLKKKMSEYEQFLWNISGKNEDRLLTICSAIGYLLHDYKIQSNAKAVVLYDEKISNNGNPEGRTGKSLIGKAIEKVKDTVRIDGKNFNFKPSFTFQQVRLSTKVIDFNDVTPDFDFEHLFSVITDGMTIEYKNKTPFEIPFSESPKILLSTNYTIKGSGSSYADRMFEIAITDHYSPTHKPKDDFGHDFFTDWTDEEWNLFYHFMIECLELYLNYGLITTKSENIEIKKIITETSQEFFNFAENNIVPNKEYSKKSLYQEFKEKIGWGSDMFNNCPVKQNTFTKYLKSYAIYKSVKYMERSSSGTDYFTIVRN